MQEQLPLFSESTASKSCGGFTLLEIALVLTVMSLMFSLLLPVSGAWLQDSRESSTMNELTSLADSVIRYFGDTGVLPATLVSLVKNDPPVLGWDGPYAGYNSGVGTGNEGFIDAWANDYVYATIDTYSASISSPGSDRTPNSEQFESDDDISITLNVHRLLREETDAEIAEINEAIQNYNSSLFASEGGLSADYAATLQTLKDKGFLVDPNGDLNTDGWGQAYVTDSAPVQRVSTLGSP